jgi:hypothetical protein
MSALSAELPIRHVRTSVAIGGNADKGKIAINHRYMSQLPPRPQLCATLKIGRRLKPH